MPSALSPPVARHLRRPRSAQLGSAKISALALVASALTLSCFDSSTSGATIIHPTLVGVSPSHFLGSVPCLNAEGAMRRYSVTLIDVTPDLPEQAFELPSSSLVPCQQAVTFSFVTPGHQYAAKIRGYDRTDLRPQRPGSPLATTPAGEVVTPRWTTECGKPVTATTPGDGTAGAGGDSAVSGAGGSDGSNDAPAPGLQVRGVTSASRFTVYADYCLPLSANGPDSDTAASVSLGAALRELECGSASGQVFDFTAELSGSSVPPKRAECGSALSFGELTPGRDYRFNVLGFESGSVSPKWETTCRVLTLQGTTTPASCDPLVER